MPTEPRCRHHSVRGDCGPPEHQDDQGWDLCLRCYTERYPCSVPGCSEPGTHEHDSRRYCEPCFDERFFTCTACDEVGDQADRWVANDENYCRTCYHERFFVCPGCNESCYLDDACHGSGSRWCESCYQERFAMCDRCEEDVPRNQLQWEEGDDGLEQSLCRGCRANSTPVRPTTFHLNPYRRTVGYELEFCGHGQHPNLHRYGNLHNDGSLSPDYSPTGIAYTREFSSRPASGDALLSQIDKVCKELARVEAYANSSCGFHLHIDVRNLPQNQQNAICLWYQAVEPMMYALVNPARQQGHYCQPIAGRRLDYTWGNHYDGLNRAAFNEHGTFEIRIHHGTVNAKEVKSWAMFMLSFFETFKDIEPTAIRLDKVRKLNARELLIFLFQQMKLPLTIRKNLVERLRLHNNQRLKLNVPAKIKRLDLSAA